MKLILTSAIITSGVSPAVAHRCPSELTKGFAALTEFKTSYTNFIQTVSVASSDLSDAGRDSVLVLIRKAVAFLSRDYYAPGLCDFSRLMIIRLDVSSAQSDLEAVNEILKSETRLTRETQYRIGASVVECENQNRVISERLQLCRETPQTSMSPLAQAVGVTGLGFLALAIVVFNFM